MKILVTGSNGQLGREMQNVLERRLPGITTYVDIDILDLTDREALERFMREGNFTHVVNCAAYTAVALAEEEKLKCTAVNVDAVANLARLADELGYKIVHVSTDYEFDGTAHRPYRESDKVNPLSVYGASKRKGVTALLGLAPESVVIRTGWMYSPYGHNFVKTMLRIGREKGRASVVIDQIGTPTYALDLAEAIVDIITNPHWTPGVFHYSDLGVCSWYDFARAIYDISGHRDWVVDPVLTEEAHQNVSRPYYSVLDKSRIRAIYGVKCPYWRHSLERCIERINSEEK